MTKTATPKTRTITMTDRPPVTVAEDAWPIIAAGSADHDDSDGRGNPPNRRWTRMIRVRQHADGRAIVYGVYGYATNHQGEPDAAARRGYVVGADLIIEHIREVGDELAEAESDADIDDMRKDVHQWRVAVQECIASLPAEEL